MFSPDYIMDYLVIMRKTSYYKNRGGIINHLLYALYLRKYRKIGKELGFSIGCDALGYGCVIPHYGTIVVGSSNRIGNYAVLHTSTCISDNGKVIGDGLYLSTGAKLTTELKLGNNVSIGANALVNKSFDSNLLLGGMPAKKIKETIAWYIRDGEEYENRVKKIEGLKKQLLGI